MWQFRFLIDNICTRCRISWKSSYRMDEGRNSLKISTPQPFRPDPSLWTVPLKIIRPHVCAFRLPMLTSYIQIAKTKYMFIGFLYEFWRDSGSIFPQYKLFVMCVFLYISFLFKSTSTRTREMYSILIKRLNFNLHSRKSNYPTGKWQTK